MKKILQTLVLSAFLGGTVPIGLPTTSQAAPSGIAGTALFQQFPMLYQGVVPLGMGGAFTAVADDENAVFYNPAGLDNIQTSSFKILDISAEGTYPALSSIYNDIQNDNKSTGTTQATAYLNTFNSYPNQSFYLQAGDYSNYTTHDFSIGLLTNNQILSTTNVVATTNNMASLAALSDTGIVVSGAYGFFNHHLQIGGTIMGLNQMFADIPTLSVNQAENIQSTINSNLTHGLGILGDVGAIYHFDLPLNPTIGASVQNIGTASFGQAGTLPQIINAGVGIDPDIGFGRLLVDIDYDDVANYLYYTGDSLWLHTHAGIQYQFPEILTLSAGLYQGYPTFGFGLDLWAFMINGSYYTEEAGVVPGQTANHIVALQVAFGWM
ncbi:MAG: PorV/PorQ family protein [Leptospirales bacterium]